MKAIVYARFSPRPDAAESESISMQVGYCRAWAARNGHEIAAVFEDPKVSGGEYERPKLWEAVAATKRGAALVAFKFDRIARDGFVWHDVERIVARQGGVILSASGEGSIERVMDPAEFLKVRMLQLFAEYERRVIQFRTRVAMRRHQLNGRRMSPTCPYGWMNDPANPKRMVRNPVELPAVIEAVRMRRAGLSYGEIAHQLACAGHYPREGRWHRSTIMHICRRADEDLELADMARE